MHIYTLKLFVSFKMAYTCCFGFGFSRYCIDEVSVHDDLFAFAAKGTYVWFYAC